MCQLVAQSLKRLNRVFQARRRAGEKRFDTIGERLQIRQDCGFRFGCGEYAKHVSPLAHAGAIEAGPDLLSEFLRQVAGNRTLGEADNGQKLQQILDGFAGVPKPDRRMLFGGQSGKWSGDQERQPVRGSRCRVFIEGEDVLFTLLAVPAPLLGFKLNLRMNRAMWHVRFRFSSGLWPNSV